MHAPSFHHRSLALAAGFAILLVSGWAMADPPSRVARLGYMAGTVTFSPAGEDDWVQAGVNRPLTTGDRLWSAAGGRAEIQIGGAMIRMNAGTSVSVLNLDDRIAQLQLTQGSLNVRVRRLEPDQTFEVDTPNLAVILRQPGAYRVDVDPDGAATTVTVRNGQAEVYGEGASYVVDSQQPYRFTGTGAGEYQPVDAQRPDDFDRWASDRDLAYDNSRSARYVSQDVVGYQDLDANGTWRVDATYGNIWTPNRVAAGWAPYRDGHWAWIDPWGWTWVDDAPWGFAVSHYGRWANAGGTWGWIPGPMRTRAYYAPALVVFVGGDNFQITLSGGNVGGVAWFPLGPREVYRPSYQVSRGYFENINTSNTVVNNTVINNYYNNTNVTNVVYANRQVPGAVVAVPTAAFVQSQPVARTAVRVLQETIARAPVAAAPHAAPTDKSVHGAASQADKPPARVFERPVVARTAPPAAHVGFAAQQPQLAARPGQPLDDNARKALKPAATAPAPVVKVIAPTQEASPNMRKLPVSPTANAAAARGRPEERKAAEAGAVPAAPVQGAAPARAASPAPQAQAPQAQPPQAQAPQAQPPQAQPPQAQPPQAQARSRETPEPRAKVEARGQPVAPAPVAPAPAPAREVAPPAAPPAPRVAAPAPAGPPGQQRAQSTKPEPAAATHAEQAAAPPRATPAGPQGQAPQQREAAEPRARGEARGQAVAPSQAQEPAQPKATPAPRVATPAPQAPQQAPHVATPAAPPAPQQAQRARPEPAAAAPQAESHSRVAAPESRPPQSQPATKTQQPEPKPAAARPSEDKKDSGEQGRQEEARKQKEKEKE